MDNAISESFVAMLKCEILHPRCFPSREAARSTVFEYLEALYNRRRFHPSLGHVTSAAYEETTRKGAAVA